MSDLSSQVQAHASSLPRRIAWRHQAVGIQESLGPAQIVVGGPGMNLHNMSSASERGYFWEPSPPHTNPHKHHTACARALHLKRTRGETTDDDR